MPTPLTPEQPPLNLHAEYLPNIRQVTLYVTLPTTQDADSKTSPTISLSESRRAVTVSIPDHTAEDEVSETIKLPARVHQASRRVLDGANTTGSRDGKPQGNTGNGNDIGINHNGNNGKGRELSFRMQIDPEDALSSTASGGGEDVVGDSYVPWMADDMGPSTKVRCRACGSLVLDDPASSPAGPGTDPGDGFSESRASSGWTWKDLPSGNWAEMMDFWHCHKPDTHDHEKDPEGKTVSIQERNSQVKGYGAANQVVARPGTVLVDVASFLVVKGDCKGLKVRFSLFFFFFFFSSLATFALICCRNTGQKEGDLLFPWTGLRYNCPILTGLISECGCSRENKSAVNLCFLEQMDFVLVFPVVSWLCSCHTETASSFLRRCRSSDYPRVVGLT